MGNCFAWFHRLLLRDKQLFFQPISHHFIEEETAFFLFSKTPFLISFKKSEKGDEMSCLDRRMTFPAYLACCGMKKAVCCDGHCSALQGQMQHVALADAPYCVCCFSQTHQLFHTNAIAVSCQNESRFGTIGLGNDNCGKTGKENWGDTAKGIFCALYSKRNMAASASECTSSHMMK